MWEETIRFVLRKEIIPSLLTIGLGLSSCATREQIRAELESEEGRALIKEAVQEEMKSMMKSEEHKAKMKEQMKEMMMSKEHKVMMKEMMKDDESINNELKT